MQSRPKPYTLHGLNSVGKSEVQASAPTDVKLQFEQLETSVKCSKAMSTPLRKRLGLMSDNLITRNLKKEGTGGREEEEAGRITEESAGQRTEGRTARKAARLPARQSRSNSTFFDSEQPSHQRGE